MPERGGQPGNQNAVKGKRWQQAIDRALAKRSKGDAIAALDELAEQFLNAVATGDKDFVPGFNALGDRLDGKPAQQVMLSGDSEAPLQVRITPTDADL